MATTKLTVQRGKSAMKDVIIAAGSAEAQTETMSLNIDYTAIRRADALRMLDAIKNRIEGSRTWPPL
jgi:pyruvate/2-oxoglutarate dehydrogenase complex dihydrolipoamide acyltransferase (E2) component